MSIISSCPLPRVCRTCRVRIPSQKKNSHPTTKVKYLISVNFTCAEATLRPSCWPIYDTTSVCFSLRSGFQTCDDSRIPTPDPKRRFDLEPQCHWEAPHGSSPHPQVNNLPIVHHSILHHQTPPAGGPAYDTLSLESSDSMETSVSTGNNSACSPERSETANVKVCL